MFEFYDESNETSIGAVLVLLQWIQMHSLMEDFNQNILKHHLYHY